MDAALTDDERTEINGVIDLCFETMTGGKMRLVEPMQVMFTAIMQQFKNEYRSAYESFKRAYSITQSFREKHQMDYNRYAISAIEKMQERIQEKFQRTFLYTIIQFTYLARKGIVSDAAILHNTEISERSNSDIGQGSGIRSENSSDTKTGDTGSESAINNRSGLHIEESTDGAESDKPNEIESGNTDSGKRIRKSSKRKNARK